MPRLPIVRKSAADRRAARPACDRCQLPTEQVCSAADCPVIVEGSGVAVALGVLDAELLAEDPEEGALDVPLLDVPLLDDPELPVPEEDALPVPPSASEARPVLESVRLVFVSFCSATLSVCASLWETITRFAS